jgi:hypothetical protein
LTILDGDNVAIPLLHDAGVNPGRYTLPEVFVLSREILRPVIEMQVSLPASGCPPDYAPGLIKNVNGSAVLGQ